MTLRPLREAPHPGGFAVFDAPGTRSAGAAASTEGWTYQGEVVTNVKTRYALTTWGALLKHS